MKHRYRLLVACLGGITSTICHAQSTTQVNDTLRLSLKEAWLKADEHSRAIVIKRKSTEARAEEVKDAQVERYPELSVAGNAEKATNIPIYENGLFRPPVQHEVIHTLYRAGADMYLNIYNGNKQNLKIQEEKILHKIALIEQDQTISDIRYKAARIYLELQKSMIFRSLMIEDIADQRKQLIEINAFQKNGVVLKSDVLRVELELSKREMTLVQIENDILIASQKLNIIIGEPDDKVIYPSDSLDLQNNYANTYEACLNEAMQHSFAYHISEEQTQLSKIHLKEIKAIVRPKVGMYGDFYYANPQIFLYPYNPYWYSLGIGGIKASFPISSLYHNAHKVRSAAIELEKEEEMHKDTEDKVRQQVKESYLRYRESLIQIQVSKVNVAHAVENARIIKHAYFGQTALITDLLDADVQVLQTRFELAAANIQAQNKYYLLQNTIGIL